MNKPNAGGVPAADLWLQEARADYALCAAFARHFDARVPRAPRAPRAPRVAWHLKGDAKNDVKDVRFLLLVPDVLPPAALRDDEWYFYSVLNESPLRRTRAEREEARALILAESADDWADLLRQAVRGQVFDIEYSVTPQYVDALGEYDLSALGFLFQARAFAPQAASVAPFSVHGSGATPAEAARAACRAWLARALPEADIGTPGG